MTRQEFERRFRARIVERLTPEWSERAARRAADCADIREVLPG